MVKQLAVVAFFWLTATMAQAVTFAFDAGDGNGTGFQQIDTVDGFGLTMAGADTDAINSIADITTFTAQAAVDAAYEINWSYFTFDFDGPAFDPFGYFVGSDFIQLTDNNGANFQFGTFVLNVLAGDEFGFFIDSTDDVENPSNAFVSGQQIAVVPLPASGLFFIAGLCGLVLWGLRRQGNAL